MGLNVMLINLNRNSRKLCVLSYPRLTMVKISLHYKRIVPCAWLAPLRPRRPSSFFLIKKKQKIKSATMLLFAHGLFARSVKTAGCNLFAHVVAQVLRFSKNLLCPSLCAAHQFYLISSEAYLLTIS